MLNKIYITVVFALFMGASSLLTSAKAQSTENKIEEVKVRQGDGFSELRKLIQANFDFTKPDLKEGLVNSEVRFQLDEKGKITNVVVKGECKNVNQELADVMTHLHTKFSASPNYSYVMPIQVAIASR